MTKLLGGLFASWYQVSTAQLRNDNFNKHILSFFLDFVQKITNPVMITRCLSRAQKRYILYLSITLTLGMVLYCNLCLYLSQANFSALINKKRYYIEINSNTQGRIHSVISTFDNMYMHVR